MDRQLGIPSTSLSATAEWRKLGTVLIVLQLPFSLLPTFILRCCKYVSSFRLLSVKYSLSLPDRCQLDNLNPGPHHRPKCSYLGMLIQIICKCTSTKPNMHEKGSQSVHICDVQQKSEGPANRPIELLEGGQSCAIRVSVIGRYGMHTTSYRTTRTFPTDASPYSRQSCCCSWFWGWTSKPETKSPCILLTSPFVGHSSSRCIKDIEPTAVVRRVGGN